MGIFEKAGIKEVANVTFSKIDRVTETFETQRTIKISSALKSIMKTTMVYPIVDGVGSDEGFQAFVFTKADILRGANYPCDDTKTGSSAFTYSKTSGTGADMTITAIVAAGATLTLPSGVVVGDITLTNGATLIESTEEVIGTYVYSGVAEFTYVDSTSVNTHQFTYEEQVLQLFAKNENIIRKNGSRFSFESGLFGTISFNDAFAVSPNSTEKLVVIGITGKFTQNTYSIEEITSAVNALTTSYVAKGYDITYTDYANLSVEDEMGYFNPDFLGTTFNRISDGNYTIGTAYPGAITDVDTTLSLATMWGEGEHLSINDAIDALRQRLQIIDLMDDSMANGISSVSGGYYVDTINTVNVTDAAGVYTYSLGTGTTGFDLEAVIAKLQEIAAANEDATVTVTANATASNRAIYVSTLGTTETGVGAKMYLLRNREYRNLAIDTTGLFTFEDKKGNVVYYRDPIFKGKEYLALTVIGDKGLIFVANKVGKQTNSKLAWMIKETSFINDTQAKTIVDKGVIHTVPLNINGELVDCTCTISNFVTKKINKASIKYVPVLFLDSLKISTLEQTAEESEATGGQGDSTLISWDFKKAITLNLEDALYSPASMSAMFGSGGNDFKDGIKKLTKLDRTEKAVASKTFVVPSGNSLGVPSEGENIAATVYIDPMTMLPFEDGTPIVEGEVYLKFTRTIADLGKSLGETIEISAEKFPGTYRITGETMSTDQQTGKEKRFQFEIPKAKMKSEQTINLEASGDPTVFSMSMKVLRPEDGKMVKLNSYEVEINETDGSTKIKGTELLNTVDEAEMFKVSAAIETDAVEIVGTTEY